jgi:hypothetical protein
MHKWKEVFTTRVMYDNITNYMEQSPSWEADSTLG